MAHLIKVATCSLNQWALDLEGNRNRIVQYLRAARATGASLAITPELSITGYGCLDHFLELDLADQCWEVLATLLQEDEIVNSNSVDSELEDGVASNVKAQSPLIWDVGMPVVFKSVIYNCRVVCQGKRVLLIRPKMVLANDGNFREMRYFTPWERPKSCEEFHLPTVIASVDGQEHCTFGDAMIESDDTTIGVELCEELFSPQSPHIDTTLDGAEILINSSGSHHQLRKLDTRMELIQTATRKCGGVYLYSNQRGCDGDRLYYDSGACVIVNGDVVGIGEQFGLKDVEMTTAVVDLAQVRSYRYAPSRRMQANKVTRYPRVHVSGRLAREAEYLNPKVKPSPPIKIKYHEPEEEIALGPACWLWDYLRRSRQAGYFVPLSGGIDSCSTAVIVYSMCRQVVKSVQEGNIEVIEDVRRICAEPKDSKWLPDDPREICNRLFATSFMGSKNSSKDTRSRAKELANSIGAYHIDMNIDTVVDAVTKLFSTIFGFQLKFKVHGGSNAENLALQNIQARLRMVLSYLFAQTIPLARQRPGGGGLLVLGSANVDEALRGYLTKYDCSSADINPIGAISKTDLKRFIAWAEKHFELPILKQFIEAVPTAELEPITESYTQSDEADMGCTYEELSVFGRLRKMERLGPWGQWTSLLHTWSDRFSPSQLYEKVRHLNHHYGINRHKMTTLTPAYHAEQYSPDDNRFDLRPFLYPPLTWAYRKIEAAIERFERAGLGEQSEEAK